SVEPVVSTTNGQRADGLSRQPGSASSSRGGSPGGGSIFWPNPGVAFDTDPKSPRVAARRLCVRHGSRPASQDRRQPAIRGAEKAGNTLDSNRSQTEIRRREHRVYFRRQSLRGLGSSFG